MNIYGNSGGDSGVRAYEFDSNSIQVEFSDLSVYEYTSSSVGSSNLAIMKNLASTGSGLNSFINLNVKFKYSRKIR